MTPQADIEQRLQEMIDGELSPAEETTLLGQVQGDERLAALLEEMREQDRQLRAYYRLRASQVSGGGRPDLRALPSARVLPARSPRRARVITFVAAAAATTLIAAGLSSFWIWGRDGALPGTIVSSGDVSTITAVASAGRTVGKGDSLEVGRSYKIPPGHVMEVAFAGGGGLEANSSSMFVPRAARSGMALELQRGEVLVRATDRSAGPVSVTTPQLTAEGRDAVFGVVRGLRGSEVTVLSGEVEVVQAGSRRRLLAGESISTENVRPMPVESRVAWSNHREDLLDVLHASASIAGPAPVPPTDPDREAILADLAVTTGFLPSDTLLLVEAPSLSMLLEPTGAHNLGELLDPATVLPELEAYSLRPGANLDPEALEAMRLVLQSEEFAVIGRALENSVAFALTPSGPLIVADVRASEREVDAVLDENIRPLMLEQGLEGELRVEVANGFLVAGVAGPEIEETLLAIQRVAPTGFASSPFLAALRDAAPDSKLTAAVNAARIAGIVRERSGADSKGTRALRRVGFDNLKAVIAASEFGDQAGNQAMRFVFDEQRSGVLGWLAEPAPLGSLRYFTPKASMIAAARIESPQVMLSSLFGWLEEDGVAFRRPETAREVALAEKIVATLGNEVAVGLDNPVLPVPNVKVILEVNDPIGFHDSMVELMELLYASDDEVVSRTVVRSDTYKGRLIIEFSHPDLPVGISCAIIDDYVVFGPGLQFTQRTIDLAEAGGAIDTEWAFLQSLPARSGSHVSLLLYESLSESLRAAAPMLAQVVPSGMLAEMDMTPQQLSESLSVEASTGPKGPTVVYGVAEENRIDFFVEGLRVGERPLGELAPQAAAIATRP